MSNILSTLKLHNYSWGCALIYHQTKTFLKLFKNSTQFMKIYNASNKYFCDYELPKMVCVCMCMWGNVSSSAYEGYITSAIFIENLLGSKSQKVTQGPRKFYTCTIIKLWEFLISLEHLLHVLSHQAHHLNLTRQYECSGGKYGRNT